MWLKYGVVIFMVVLVVLESILVTTINAAPNGQLPAIFIALLLGATDVFLVLVFKDILRLQRHETTPV